VFSGKFPFGCKALPDLIGKHTLRLCHDKGVVSKIVNIITGECREGPRLEVPPTLPVVLTPRNTLYEGLAEAKGFLQCQELDKNDLRAMQNLLDKKPEAFALLVPSHMSMKGKIAFLQIILQFQTF
jgi:hypothetical protein